MSGVEKSYPGGFRAVDHLDLEVNDGEFFTLLGPSGCGKTTTLRIIAGLETPSSGKVFIGGRETRPAHGAPAQARLARAKSEKYKLVKRTWPNHNFLCYR